MPILPCIGVMVSPGDGRSTMRGTKPFDPSVMSKEASTTITSASWALVMNTFAPFKTYAPLSRTAVARIAAASLPALGSVSANAAIVLPDAMLGRYLCLCASVPYIWMKRAASD